MAGKESIAVRAERVVSLLATINERSSAFLRGRECVELDPLGFAYDVRMLADFAFCDAYAISEALKSARVVKFRVIDDEAGDAGAAS
jgi:hypothetical protein